MKRELKENQLDAVRGPVAEIARPIPMKRELKGLSIGPIFISRDSHHCKAHPDEKGTKRFLP